MKNHLKIHHPELLDSVNEAQVALKPADRVEDLKDESVRGSVPLFKLRNKLDRAAWLKQVNM